MHLAGDFINIVADRLITDTEKDAQHVVRPTVALLNGVKQHTIEGIHLAPSRVGSTTFRWSLIKLGDNERYVSRFEPRRA